MAAIQARHDQSRRFEAAIHGVELSGGRSNNTRGRTPLMQFHQSMTRR